MTAPIDLNDENYLRNYEEQIRNLPLGELYEVLGIVKKDSTDQRVKIVSARIHQLEADLQIAKENRKKAPKVKKAKVPKDNSHQKESPVKLFFRKVFWIGLLAVFLATRIQDVAQKIFDGTFDIAESVMTLTMDVLPFFCFGIGYKIARRFTMTKKKKFHLGIALFLISKAIISNCFEVYLGVACQFYDEKATYMSIIVFATALLFAINMFRRKIKDKFATNGMLPMAIALLAEQQIWMM